MRLLGTKGPRATSPAPGFRTNGGSCACVGVWVHESEVHCRLSFGKGAEMRRRRDSSSHPDRSLVLNWCRRPLGHAGYVKCSYKYCCDLPGAAQHARDSVPAGDGDEPSGFVASVMFPMFDAWRSRPYFPCSSHDGAGVPMLKAWRTIFSQVSEVRILKGRDLPCATAATPLLSTSLHVSTANRTAPVLADPRRGIALATRRLRGERPRRRASDQRGAVE